MDDLSVEELASNLSTYKDQLREVSLPHLGIASDPRFFTVISLYILLFQKCFPCYGQNLGSVASCSVPGFRMPCIRGFRFWMWREWFRF